MPIQNEKFSLLVSDSSGNPLTGSLVELRKDAMIYTLTEVGNGWYSMNSIPTGKYSVFVDSVDTGETKAVGSGQIAALGNTADSVPVSDATEYSFQDPTTLKTTLSLNNVTNVAVPSPTGSDANKVVRVDSNGDYVLASVTASGFESVYEILTTADLTIALSDEYDSKLLVISREDFNFTNAQTFEVWGSCSIIVANTSEPFQWSSNAVNATFNLKSGADSSLTGMFFLNGVIAFGDTSDYTLNIPWKVTNLDFISPEVSRSVNGSSTLTYELLKAAIPGSVTVTTAQDWWQNSAADKLDTVAAGTNVTIDNTDPQNPIVNTVPSGSDTQLQFNDGGSFGGDTGLTYNKTTDSLTALGNITGTNIVGTSSITSQGDLDVATNITVGGTVDSRDVAADGAILDTLNGNSSRYAYNDVDNNFSSDQAFQGDINASQVVNLASYNNVSPITGDIWRDSTSGAIEIEGDTAVNGDLDVTGSVFLSSNRRLYANSYVDLEDETGWGVRLDGSNDALRPLVDNDTELGISVRRWSKVWATDGDFSGSVNIGDVLNLVPRASDPTSPADGDIWYNSTSGTFKCRANGVTETIAFV